MAETGVSALLTGLTGSATPLPVNKASPRGWKPPGSWPKEGAPLTDESLPEGLEPLNEENFSQELEALREDLLNWDCGHEPLGLENESE